MPDDEKQVLFFGLTSAFGIALYVFPKIIMMDLFSTLPTLVIYCVSIIPFIFILSLIVTKTKYYIWSGIFYIAFYSIFSFSSPEHKYVIHTFITTIMFISLILTPIFIHKFMERNK